MQSIHSSLAGGLALLIALALLALAPACLTAQEAVYRHHGDALLPDSLETPGAVATTDTSKICHPGYSKSVRHVSAGVKRQVYEVYGAHAVKATCCEVDHLISLELGGSNEIANLWPEPYLPHPGARDKDVVENWLHRQVCQGQIPIAEAQKEIAEDWYAVYLRIPHRR
ncbi:MAG: HNH endonuclease [Gemmatimonadales bacterium]